MAQASTICTDLADRIAYYQSGNQGKCKSIPVTLDELGWLAEAVYGEHVAFVPTQYHGVVLRLVENIIETSGAFVVEP